MIVKFPSQTKLFTNKTVKLAVTDGGVSRFDGSNWSYYAPDDLQEEIWVISIDAGPGGTTWAGGWGLARIDEEGWTRYRTYVRVRDEDSDGPPLIVASFDGTAPCTHEVTLVSCREGRARGVYLMDELKPVFVQSVSVAPDGTVWFGAENTGLSRFDDQTWTTYTSRDGLAGDWVNAISMAPDGSVWVGTAHGGVSRFQPDPDVVDGGS